MYPDNAACIDYVVLLLDGDATEWLVAFHDDAQELGHFDTFMRILQQGFEDPYTN